MSLFGGQGRPAGGAEPPVQEAERPALPKAQNSTVIAKGMTVRGTLRGKGGSPPCRYTSDFHFLFTLSGR